jgi:hypothetical protein
VPKLPNPLGLPDPQGVTDHPDNIRRKCKHCGKIIPRGGHHTLWIDGSCMVFNPLMKR